MTDIAGLRQDYKLKTLDEKDVSPDPIMQFSKWWDEAVASDIAEVNAMTLSTVDETGQPSSRIVLLKGFDQNGFVFFTNYRSHKASQMEANEKVSLLFFWKELERQVRIQGVVSKIPASDSDEYFQSRPEGSKIGAWASPQSQVIPSRNIIEDNVKEIEKKFGGMPVSRPPHWGGYIVRPNYMEFWQGRSSRLHDRIQFEPEAGGTWRISRLAP
jgi:pyridoxamine 5'-phosphate oxidase